jgi:hypothetical protein
MHSISDDCIVTGEAVILKQDLLNHCLKQGLVKLVDPKA